MNRPLVATLVSALVVGVGVWLGAGSAAGGDGHRTDTFVASPGDVVRVLDARIACRVVRVRELGKRLAFDCRRGGPLAGTFGTLLTAREAALVKFTSSTSGKVVSVARHEEEQRRCS